MANTSCRILAVGAHPDDCEFRFGGTAALLTQRGAAVRMVSVTDGRAGHHDMQPDALIPRRAAEAKAAADLIGAESCVMDIPDGQLQPTLENRDKLIGEIRRFKPDLILTHRPNDYHPDHRYTSQLVQDAAYLVVVPLVLPQVPALQTNPRFGYFSDAFMKPCPFEPDVLVDIESTIDIKIDMLACHESQVFEWLPWVNKQEADVPTDAAARRNWLAEQIKGRDAKIAERFTKPANALRYAEAFECCEYGAIWDEAFVDRVFSQIGATRP